MFRRLVLAALAMISAGVVSTAEAQIGRNDKWVSLGTRKVALVNERDTIDLEHVQGRFKAVRLVANKGDILINKVQVVYENGKVHNEERTINLLQGERTRPIDLRGDERFVDKVHLFYRSIPGTALISEVEVFGLQSPEGAKAGRTRPSAPGAGAAAPSPAAPGPVATAPTAPERTKAAPGTLTAGGDVLFGFQNVGFAVDRDVIRVGAEVGKFDKIRLRVLENDIFIKELKVVYANGEPDTLAVDSEIKQNSRTKWFTLKGDRFIKEIQMVYRSRPNFKGQARVEVFGEYAEGWLGPQGEGRKYNQGWVLLGAQTAGFVGFDNDVIPVGRNEGGFTKLRVSVRERAITLNELRVVYANGQEDIIPIKTKVEAGSSYGPIDLKGGVRAIKEIKAKWRSRLIDGAAKGKGNAIVEVWAQH